MVAQHLKWRRLGPGPVSVDVEGRTFVTDVNDIITNSSSYWEVVSGTSGVDDFVLLGPTQNNTSGDPQTQQILFVTELSASAYFRFPDAPHGGAQYNRLIHVGFIVDHTVGPFERFDHPNPYGGGDWSRYWNIAVSQTDEAVGIFESEESLVLGYYKRSSNVAHICAAGNLLEISGSAGDPLLDGTRFYGMMVVGSDGVIDTDFWARNAGDPGEFMSHAETNQRPHCGIFSGSNWTIMNRSGSDVGTWGTDDPQYINANGNRQGFPIDYFSGSSASGQLLGSTRGILRSSDTQGAFFMSGSSVTGRDHVYGFNRAYDTPSEIDSLYMWPASGSLLPPVTT